MSIELRREMRSKSMYFGGGVAGEFNKFLFLEVCTESAIVLRYMPGIRQNY